MVTAYKVGVEIISTEDMLTKWDALNKKNEDWSPDSWWEGMEEDGLVACGGAGVKMIPCLIYVAVRVVRMK